jgi:hypothetical protein
MPVRTLFFCSSSSVSDLNTNSLARYTTPFKVLSPCLRDFPRFALIQFQPRSAFPPIFSPCLRGFPPRLQAGLQPASSCRAITILWISLVPSPIVISLASLYSLSTG